MTWVHSCIAIDAALNHLTIVVNGHKLEDKAFPIPAEEQHPNNLAGKLFLFKRFFGLWYQCKNKVSNLNIRMSQNNTFFEFRLCSLTTGAK